MKFIHKTGHFKPGSPPQGLVPHPKECVGFIMEATSAVWSQQHWPKRGRPQQVALRAAWVMQMFCCLEKPAVGFSLAAFTLCCSLNLKQCFEIIWIPECMWKIPDSCIYSAEFDKPKLFPYRHAIDLSTGWPMEFPRKLTAMRKPTRCRVLLLKIEQAPCPFSQSSWLQGTRMLFVKDTQEEHAGARLSHGALK